MPNPEETRFKFKNWIPVIIICLGIFVLSSLQGPTLNNAGLGKQAVHVNGHFILYFLLCIAFFKATKNVFGAAALSFVYAITDEIHQIFVPGRSWQYFDLFVDGIGILLAGVFVWILLQSPTNKLRELLMK